MKAKNAIFIALCATAFVTASSTASAQSYGGISLSFGSEPAYDYNGYYGGDSDDYAGYGYPYQPDNDANYAYYYNQPTYNYDYYRGLRQRQEHIEHEQRERQREYARHERNEHREWQHEQDQYGNGDDEGD